MAIPPELEAKILRYFHVEKWKVGTIARQLGVHHGTVDRVLSQAGLPKVERPHRTSLIDPYLPFVLQILEQYPSLTASRLYAMVRERGYSGGEDHFRHLIAHHRPRPQPEAYLRLKTLPGEQAQVDWGHFGKLTIGKGERTLMAFVMVLSFSRAIFLRFFLDAQMANFLRGHEAAFTAWGGLSRVVLYDNLKSAVLERQGEAIRFHPTLLEFAASSPSRRAIVTAATESLNTFTAVLHISSTLSTTRIMPTASIGSPMAERIIVIATRLADGIPATPIDVSNAISTIVNWVVRSSDRP